MKVLRWVAGLVGVAFAGLLLFAVAVRFADGPVGAFPGGPLADGPMVHAPVEDWGFAEAVELIELQLMEPPRSRTTWILVAEGRAFIPCGFPGIKLWKQWPHQAIDDGRALVRIEGRRLPVQLARIEDSGLEQRLGEDMRRKYPSSAGVELEVWYFELTPPEGQRGG
ncbi:MAG: hypothetical protein JRG96_08350 [Deltaproteobacteria bacterium]|nr:hypothetical protein [Deltaproteobacteria bacterium]MBW2418039.1 hypothetical protein [Deltaproteobacteria bacterium]